MEPALRQHQEGGLEGILGVLGVVQHAPADAEDHRSMPPHQQLERRLIAVLEKTLQQMRIGDDSRQRRPQASLHVFENGRQGSGHHVCFSVGDLLTV